MSTLNVNRGEAELADSVGRSRLCRPKSEGKCKTRNSGTDLCKIGRKMIAYYAKKVEILLF